MKVLTKEYRDGDYAVRETEISIFNITIFRYKKISTNSKAVALYTIANKSNKITGFV